MADFYPVIGKTDNYKFLPPFDKLDKDIPMTVVGSELLREYKNSSVDVLKIVYEKNGLGLQELLDDIIVEARLVTLKSKNEVYYIPSTYLNVSTPDMRTHVYNRKVLVIDLGELPSNESVEDLVDEIRDTTIGVLGITPAIQTAIVSEDSYVVDLEHVRKLSDRAVARTTNYTSKGRVVILEKDIAKKQNIIDQLKQIIKTLSPP